MKADSEYRKGLWTTEEDRALIDYIRVHGKGKWNRIAKETGLKRCGKSCRLRWMNYLSPAVKRGDFTEEEDDLIIRLHNLLGNKWSLIAGRVPGRTDNQVKNHWNTHLSKKLLELQKKKITDKISTNEEVTKTINSEPILSSSEEVEKEFCICSNGLSESPNTSNVVGEADQVNSIDNGDKNSHNNNINDNNSESSFWFSSADDFISPISSYYDLVEPLDDIVWDIGLY